MALPEIRGEMTMLADPRTGTTSAGKPWTSAFGKFATWRKDPDSGKWQEGESFAATVGAFGDLAAGLATYGKGDKVGVHGTCSPAIYNDKPQLKVTLTRECWAGGKDAR